METEDGKTIRTTGNHPYLVKEKLNNQPVFDFETDNIKGLFAFGFFGMIKNDESKKNQQNNSHDDEENGIQHNLFFTTVANNQITNDKQQANYNVSNQEDRKSTRLNSSHTDISRMPSSA